MRDGQPSLSAQRVAARRVAFPRAAATFGDPSADDALARDVAGGGLASSGGLIEQYLRARTSFFDRVMVDAIDRGVSQIVLLGAGYDGRSLRYRREGVSWWEIDHPVTQADKRARMDRLGLPATGITFVSFDLESPGLATALVESGFDPDRSSLQCCEGVAAYLTPDALECLLTEVRAVATDGTRIALSLSVTPASEEAADRHQDLHGRLAALGEPIVSSLRAQDAFDLFARTRWRQVDATDRSELAGLVVARPI
ncbi:MAG: SAM-dependent methyltransferase [Acidimicrobiales bacterium]